MRIAFVPAARLLSEQAPNGEALIASALLRRLAARGHEILAYCERSELPPIDGVEVRRVPVAGPTVVAARLRFARAIARDVEREDVDIAHLLFPFNTDDGCSFVRSAPLVVGPVNGPWPQGTEARARGVRRITAAAGARVERRAHARTVQAARAVLVTGESARRRLPELNGRCIEVPFGVDTHRFLPRPFPPEPTILFPSVVQRRKGIEVLIRALPLVVRRIPRARLVVAGSDPEGLRSSLEALAGSLGVAGDVTFIGEVSPDRMPALFGRATVVCQPSFGEPFGMTVIEAMATGRPVVGTASGGIPDAVIDGRGGRLVPEGDERLLADALCWVLSDPDRAADMGAHNRSLVEARYALDDIVERLEVVYREVASARGVLHAS